MIQLSSRESVRANREYVGGVGRRSVLKAAGVALAGSVLATGSAGASRGGVTSMPGSAAVGDGQATTYAERSNGRLSAVGVRLDASVLDGLPTSPTEYQLSLPGGDTGRFEFVGVDYNPAGHDPLFLYGNPHFDVHFYMLDGEAVAAIPGGPATYDIPGALMPAATVTTADLPSGASPRFVVPAMGEHLVSLPASLPSTPGSDGWSVFIWGASDPDGDGTGQLTFMEPMITTAYLHTLRGDGTADAAVTTAVPMPERFLKAGWYPTECAVRYDSDDDAFTVSLEGFERFAGYGRR